VFEEADTDVLVKKGSRRVELAPAPDRVVYVPGRRRAEEGDEELVFPGMKMRTPAVEFIQQSGLMLYNVEMASYLWRRLGLEDTLSKGHIPCLQYLMY